VVGAGEGWEWEEVVVDVVVVAAAAVVEVVVEELPEVEEVDVVDEGTGIGEDMVDKAVDMVATVKQVTEAMAQATTDTTEEGAMGITATTTPSTEAMGTMAATTTTAAPPPPVAVEALVGVVVEVEVEERQEPGVGED